MTSNTTSNKRSEFATKVTANASKSPQVQTGIEATYDNNTLTVNYNTKFFAAVSGEYFLGLYLIEKEVIGYQAAQGNNAKHRKVLRQELTGKSFGSLIDSGDISAEKSYEGTMHFDISKYSPENLEIASIVWRKEDDKYIIVNSNVDDEVSFSGTNSTDRLVKSKLSGFNIFPTIVEKNVTLEITLTSDISNTAILLLDYNGQVISKKTIRQLTKGLNQIQFDIPANIVDGFYYLRIVTDNRKSYTKKMIVSRN